MRKDENGNVNTPFVIVVSEIPLIGQGDGPSDSDATIVRDIWKDRFLEAGAVSAVFTTETVELGEPPRKDGSLDALFAASRGPISPEKLL